MKSLINKAKQSKAKQSVAAGINKVRSRLSKLAPPNYQKQKGK
jgi:hypothetical protein